MRGRIITGIIVLLLVGSLSHEPGHTNPPWNGVSFHYRFQKLGATVLKATLSVERKDHLYVVKAAVDSTGVTAPFFRMHNRFCSYVEREGLEPTLYVKEVNQWGVLSRKKCYTDILNFDLGDSKVIVERREPPQVREVAIPPQTYDPLTIFLKYFLDAETGNRERIEMRIYDGIKVREVIFLATREEISTRLYGSVETTCLESKIPFATLGDREGVIKIWYVEDERRFPVDITLELPAVGSVEFELESVEMW